MSLRATLLLTLSVAATSPAVAQCTIDHLHGPGNAQAFGVSMSASNGRVLVGSIYDSYTLPSAGAAFVYELTPSGFVRDVIEPQTPSYDGRFGESVAMVGDQALVGALDDEFGVAAGAVFVHEKTASGWQVVQKLTASDAHAGGNFGVTMDSSGERVVIGSTGGGTDRGAAYVFERTGGVWAEVQRLAPSTTHAYNSFGADVAIDGDRLVVGSYGSATLPLTAGAAFVFDESNGVWSQTQRLSPAGLEGLDFVASALDLCGDRIVIGASGENLFSDNMGAAYVYELESNGWTRKARLTGTLVSLSAFGMSISMDDERIAIGAGPSWLTPTVAKTVETFRGSGANWTSEGYEIGHGPGFGSSVQLWGNAVLAGGDADAGVSSVRIVGIAREAQLIAGRGDLSASAQDVQTLEITTCPNLAGAPYRVIGSLDGAGSFTVGPIDVPFGFDRYTRLTLSQPGLTSIGGAGYLDASGRATAGIRMQGAAQTAFVGSTLWHAAVVFDGLGQPQTVTNAVSATIRP